MTGEGAGNVERLVFFSDAVVAIAITLLALPLAEVPHDERTGVAENPATAQLLLDVFPLIGAALSFFVVARLWWAHHQLFARVERFSMPLVVTNIIWLFTIVVLSASSALVAQYRPDQNPPIVLTFIGTMTVSALALTAVALAVHLGHGLTTESRAGTRDRVVGSAFTAGTFAVAAVIGFLVPAINYFAIWLLVPSGFLESAVKRRLRARDGLEGPERVHHLRVR